VAPKASILDEKLADLFAQAVGGALDSLRDLRESVCLYVEAERARGASLDEVITRVSTMLGKVRESGGTKSLIPETEAAERDLAREMVGWCIDSYLPDKARKKS
jgi:hypothetical protein